MRLVYFCTLKMIYAVQICNYTCLSTYLYVTYDAFGEKEHRDVSPPFIARIPKSYVTTNVITPTISSCKESEKIDENDKPNVRATPILRPRAVLSSPDNDAVIGNKNRTKAERPAALKNRNSVQNRHLNAQCKVTPSRVIAKSQINTNLSNDTTTTPTTTTMDNKSDLKGKNGPTVAFPSQRRYLRTGKSGPVKT
ncbi:hypothetical protein Dsin_027246 [Dipteronia sinensis]|uniref:Uncharacterized protein n=1 Tax=Dipteronia sinensis TaxID=43782 RepID=A0AAD9ZNZ7_9ROSI|nr:hypothetical protein Dsin_027246 [Dipteronia sinensis]